MPRPQITIAKLILAVLVAAIVLAALRGASLIWAGAMFSITFFALFCSLLGIGLGRGLRRIYWSGFALLGWGYLLVFYAPAWGPEARVGEFFLAPSVCSYLDDVLQTVPEVVVAPGTPVTSPTPSPLPPGGDPSQGNGLPIVPPAGMAMGFIPAPVPFSGPALGPFPSERVRVGIAIEALLWAFLGGWVARYFASEPAAARASAVATTEAPMCEIGAALEPQT